MTAASPRRARSGPAAAGGRRSPWARPPPATSCAGRAPRPASARGPRAARSPGPRAAGRPGPGASPLLETRDRHAAAASARRRRRRCTSRDVVDRVHEHAALLGRGAAPRGSLPAAPPPPPARPRRGRTAEGAPHERQVLGRSSSGVDLGRHHRDLRARVAAAALDLARRDRARRPPPPRGGRPASGRRGNSSGAVGGGHGGPARATGTAAGALHRVVRAQHVRHLRRA